MIASRVLCRGADTAIINGGKIEVTLICTIVKFQQQMPSGAFYLIQVSSNYSSETEYVNFVCMNQGLKKLNKLITLFPFIYMRNRYIFATSQKSLRRF